MTEAEIAKQKRGDNETDDQFMARTGMSPSDLMKWKSMYEAR